MHVQWHGKGCIPHVQYAAGQGHCYTPLFSALQAKDTAMFPAAA